MALQDICFFDATKVIAPNVEGHNVSFRPVDINVLPSFGKVEFLDNDEQLETQLFYIDESKIDIVE